MSYQTNVEKQLKKVAWGLSADEYAIYEYLLVKGFKTLHFTFDSLINDSLNMSIRQVTTAVQSLQEKDLVHVEYSPLPTYILAMIDGRIVTGMGAAG